MTTVMNLNGMPQLVTVMPQYVVPNTMAPQPLLGQPQTQGMPVGYMGYGATPPLSSWEEAQRSPSPPPAAAQGSGRASPPEEKPPAPASAWSKSAGGAEADARAPKRLMFRGREVRSVGEAAEMGALLELAHDQNGCRFLQDQLDLRNRAHVDTIFEAVKTDVLPLSTDPFGNYLIQKLLQYGTSEQRTQLVAASASEMVNIALNVP